MHKLVKFARYNRKDIHFIVEELLKCGGKRLMDYTVEGDDNLEIVKE